MHYEGLLRVPLIARGPQIPAGKVVGDPVSTLDLAATMFDYSASRRSSARSMARASAP